MFDTSKDLDMNHKDAQKKAEELSDLLGKAGSHKLYTIEGNVGDVKVAEEAACEMRECRDSCDSCVLSRRNRDGYVLKTRNSERYRFFEFSFQHL